MAGAEEAFGAERERGLRGREDPARRHGQGGYRLGCRVRQGAGRATSKTTAESREAFRSRGLDHAIWGHISDGNVHPNVIPRSYADVEAGKEVILALGEEVVRLGGSPLAEHGVGRHPVKQALVRSLFGDEGIQEMRAVKAALDPEGKLAPGVLFAESHER